MAGEAVEEVDILLANPTTTTITSRETSPGEGRILATMVSTP